jgi:glycosyltransferase involved in cell wall biosynthesis
LLGRLLSRRFHIPHTSTCHNIFKHSICTSHFPHSVIAPSNAVADSLRQYYGPRREIKLINLGILPLRVYSAEEIARRRREMGIDSDATIIASVGQLIPSKDRETLLHAAVELRQALPDKKFVILIVGAGEQREGLIALSKIFELEKCVRFLPASEDVEMIFNLCSFGVLSSIREGMPYVLLEAGSVGKPHVATSVGGVEDFISNDVTGLVVPPKNPRELAAAMARLLINPQEAIRMGASAKSLFENGFGFDRLLDETVAHYSSLLLKIH